MNKNKQYKNLENQIASIADEIQTRRSTLEETAARIEETKAGLSSLREALKTALVGDNQERIPPLEGQISDAERLSSRDRLLIQGLREAIPELEEKKKALETNLNQLFFALTRAWLEAEKVAYDRVAEELRVRISRLFAARNMLQEKNNMSLYSDSLGGAYELLPKLKIPIMSNFDKSTLINNRQANPYAFQADVLGEITK